MIDSHAHLDCKPLHTNLLDVLQRAKQISLRAIINVGVNIQSSRNSVQLAHQYPMIFASVGVHPDDIYELESQDGQQQLEHLLQANKVVAIGEIGLDYYRLDPNDTIKKAKQQQYFRWQLQLAKKYHLPVIIHSRNSAEDTFHIIQEEHPQRAVMHCYAYDLDFAKQFLALDENYMISFTGTITFPNAKTTQDVAQHIPLQRMMIETDAPFLAPQVYRGKTNEPSYVVEVAKKIAELKQISMEEVEKQTDQNAFDFFHVAL
jgi:TatD DNase family protein